MRRVAILAVLFALAGCGAQRDLKPAAGDPLPPAPYGASEAPTPAELMTPTTTQRPRRSDELLTRSQERQDDPFDLPPR